jgi:hypothetical protein
MSTQPLYHYQATYVGDHDEDETRRAILWCTDGSDESSRQLKDAIEHAVVFLKNVIADSTVLSSAGLIVDSPSSKKIHVLLFRKPLVE